MKRPLSIGLVALLSVTTSACTITKEDTGTAVGAVVGGVLGSQVGGGRGRTAAIIAGTLAGAWAGRSIARYWDSSDDAKAVSTLNANSDHETSEWRNPNTGTEVSMAPTSTYKNSSGEWCRQFDTSVNRGGEVESTTGTACRQADGTWRFVD